MSAPVRVFVSYASEDRPFALRLVQDLRAAGAEVWWDVSGINEGDFLDKINEALQHCEWFVFVLTSHAIRSRWVKNEVNAAIHRREKGLIRGVLPILAGPIQFDAVPPLWDNLHRYDAVGDYSGEVGRLLGTLGLSTTPRTANVRFPGALAEPHTAKTSMVSLPPRLRRLGFVTHAHGHTEYIVPPMCAVPAGAFLMGSDHDEGQDVESAERPQHKLTLPAFEIGRFPVTVVEYARFVASGRRAPRYWDTQQRSPSHPVVFVSWHDSEAYAAWLAKQTGEPWRLPTEAEWEKAARGTDGRTYPWGDTFDVQRCNTREGRRKKRKTSLVYAYPNGASPYGAQDMAGNVLEWTQSRLKSYPLHSGGRGERIFGATNRVLRGGAWSRDARFARTAYRGSGHPDAASTDVGFRLVLALAR